MTCIHTHMHVSYKSKFAKQRLELGSRIRLLDSLCLFDHVVGVCHMQSPMATKQKSLKPAILDYIFLISIDTEAWSSVEAGIIYAMGAYCLDRFNRNPGSRLDECCKLEWEFLYVQKTISYYYIIYFLSYMLITSQKYSP